MIDLKELAQIVTRTKLRHVELISSSSNGQEQSKIQQLYDMLQDETVYDDDEAAKKLYGEDKDKQYSSYQKLRGTLKDRMINSLFLIDLKQASYNDRQKAYYECYREWAAAKILFGKFARTAAITISRKVIKIARKFEFTELLVDILHTLRLYHGTIEGDFKKFKQYNAEFNEQQARWLEENKAEELYIDLSIGFVNTKATKTDIKEKAEAYYAEIKDSLEKYDTYQLHLCGRLIEVSQYTGVNDYEQSLDVCNRAIDFFEAKSFKTDVPLQIFYYQKLICQLQLRHFDEAFATAEKCETFLQEGAFNWFKIQETYFLLYMHNKEYEKAYASFQLVINHPKFEGLPENIKETWIISEGYLYFLYQLEILKGEEIRLRPFRLDRFMKEIQLFTRDKQGMNIPVLILEFIFHVIEKNNDYLIDRVEALDKYRKRYLKEEQVQRSALFLKMLLQLPKNAFDVDEATAKAEADFQALQAVPIEIANQAYEIEIIPYEKLWDMIINWMKA
jgi:hypothetical protein